MLCWRLEVDGYTVSLSSICPSRWFLSKCPVSLPIFVSTPICSVPPINFCVLRAQVPTLSKSHSNQTAFITCICTEHEPHPIRPVKTLLLNTSALCILSLFTFLIPTSSNPFPLHSLSRGQTESCTELTKLPIPMTRPLSTTHPPPYPYLPILLLLISPSAYQSIPRAQIFSPVQSVRQVIISQEL